MKAAVFHEYEGPVEIAEVAKPELQDSSVLVEVYAASLNPIDNILRAGYLRQMLELTFPHVKGYDVSGTVVEIGKNVKSVKIGDEVFARPNQMDAGSVAEFARIQEDELAIKPSNMTHEQAASVPLAGLTAWQALVTKGKIKKGSKVLIHAGSGGVGTLAIQIAKHFGAFVATTTSGKNAGFVKELGADLIINYTTQNFEDELSDYDLVIDTIGGETLARSFKVLKKGGTMVSVKSQDNDNLAEKYGVHFEWFLCLRMARCFLSWLN
jgi:NADPH:quinone reductase-like Zn-dependent oxidoreductase